MREERLIERIHYYSHVDDHNNQRCHDHLYTPGIERRQSEDHKKGESHKGCPGLQSKIDQDVTPAFKIIYS